MVANGGLDFSEVLDNFCRPVADGPETGSGLWTSTLSSTALHRL